MVFDLLQSVRLLTLDGLNLSSVRSFSVWHEFIDCSIFGCWGQE